jgi:uncharacterized lipoprotein YajG
MLKSGIAITVLASVLSLAGCATKSETIGTASGAAIGAAVSNGGTIGTLGGAMVGYGLGRSYDQSHR